MVTEGRLGTELLSVLHAGACDGLVHAPVRRIWVLAGCVLSTGPVFPALGFKGQVWIMLRKDGLWQSKGHACLTDRWTGCQESGGRGSAGAEWGLGPCLWFLGFARPVKKLNCERSDHSSRPDAAARGFEAEWVPSAPLSSLLRAERGQG